MTATQKKELINANVSQSNALTSAKYDLSLQAKRVLWMCLMQAYKEGKGLDEISNVFQIRIADYQHLFPMTTSRASGDVRDGVHHLARNYVSFFPDDGVYEEIGIPWLAQLGMKVGRGAWELELNPKIMPFIHGLTKEFTTFSLFDIQQLKSVRNIRLYECFCQFRSSGIWVTTPEWLADRFELPQSQRSNFFEMKRTFLHPALKKIKEHTPINAEMTVSDDGKLVFTIVEKTPQP